MGHVFRYHIIINTCDDVTANTYATSNKFVKQHQELLYVF